VSDQFYKGIRFKFSGALRESAQAAGVIGYLGAIS